MSVHFVRQDGTAQSGGDMFALRWLVLVATVAVVALGAQQYRPAPQIRGEDDPRVHRARASPGPRPRRSCRSSSSPRRASSSSKAWPTLGGASTARSRSATVRS